MSWNRSVGHWAELKGKAKKQLDKFKGAENDDAFYKSNHSIKSFEPRKNIKDRADEHMSNLHGLLSNMRGYNMAHNEILKTEFDDDSAETKKNHAKLN